jgi:hypothetical protein
MLGQTLLGICRGFFLTMKVKRKDIGALERKTDFHPKKVSHQEFKGITNDNPAEDPKFYQVYVPKHVEL